MAKTETTETVETTKTVETAAPTLTFVDEDAPVRHTRTSNAVNPFAEKVAAMAADWDNETGRSKRSARFSVPTNRASASERQVREAVRSIGRGIRISKEEADGVTTFRFQLAPLAVGAGRPKGSGKAGK